MLKGWEELVNAAKAVVNPREVSDSMYIGSVGAAVLSKSGHIYTGVCIDTSCSLGMCAERNAISTMLTNREYEIVKVCAVYKDGTVMPPCGACREYMTQLTKDASEVEVLLSEDRSAPLSALLPEHPF